MTASRRARGPAPGKAATSSAGQPPGGQAAAALAGYLGLRWRRKR
jgi:hypothetical protein